MSKKYSKKYSFLFVSPHITVCRWTQIYDNRATRQCAIQSEQAIHNHSPSLVMLNKKADIHKYGGIHLTSFLTRSSTSWSHFPEYLWYYGVSWLLLFQTVQDLSGILPTSPLTKYQNCSQMNIRENGHLNFRGNCLPSLYYSESSQFHEFKRVDLLSPVRISSPLSAYVSYMHSHSVLPSTLPPSFC